MVAHTFNPSSRQAKASSLLHTISSRPARVSKKEKQTETKTNKKTNQTSKKGNTMGHYLAPRNSVVYNCMVNLGNISLVKYVRLTNTS